MDVVGTCLCIKQIGSVLAELLCLKEERLDMYFENFIRKMAFPAVIANSLEFPTNDSSGIMLNLEKDYLAPSPAHFLFV